MKLSPLQLNLLWSLADGREIRWCVGTTATVHRLDNGLCENTVSQRTLDALLKHHLIIEDYRHRLAAGVHCYRLTEQGKRVAERGE